MSLKYYILVKEYILFFPTKEYNQTMNAHEDYASHDTEITILL